MKAAVARCRVLARTLERRCALEISRWTRGTLLALIGFGCILILLGGLFTYAIARGVYVGLQRGNTVGVDDGGFSAEAGIWIAILLLIFGGNFVRWLSWCELHRRSSTVRTPARAIRNHFVDAATTAGLAFLVAPVMLLWGAVGVISLISWFRMYFLSSPFRMWLRNIQLFNASTLMGLSMRWCFTLIWLAGAVSLFWIALRWLRKRLDSAEPSMPRTP